MITSKEILQKWTVIESLELEKIKDVFFFNEFIKSENCLLKCYLCSQQKLQLVSKSVLVSSPCSENSSLCISFMNCPSCQLDVYTWCCQRWVETESLLDFAMPGDFNLIKLVNCPKDLILIFLLSTICHNQRDIDIDSDESPVQCRFDTDLIYKIFYREGSATGFYILKDGGSQLLPLQKTYLPLVDFLYVRKKFRNTGIGTAMIKDVLKTYDGTNIYFTTPISNSLCKVLRSILNANPSLKALLWGVDGELDARFNVHFYLITEAKCLLKMN